MHTYVQLFPECSLHNVTIIQDAGNVISVVLCLQIRCSNQVRSSVTAQRLKSGNQETHCCPLQSDSAGYDACCQPGRTSPKGTDPQQPDKVLSNEKGTFLAAVIENAAYFQTNKQSFSCLFFRDTSNTRATGASDYSAAKQTEAFSLSCQSKIMASTIRFHAAQYHEVLFYTSAANSRDGYLGGEFAACSS